MKNYPDSTSILTANDTTSKVAVPHLQEVALSPEFSAEKKSRHVKPSVALPQLAQSKNLQTTLRSSKPSAVIEHIRKHYSNYLVVGSSMGNTMETKANGLRYSLAHKQTWHNGVSVLFQELLSNSIDEFLEGHGKVIDVLCSSETITIRDYGRGIPHNQLRSDTQELGQSQKINNSEIQFCEGLSGLGLKLVNALSSQFLLRSYRNQKFAEMESARGVTLRERRGRCDKKNGTFIRFTPDTEIFGWQAVRVPQLFDILCKISALYPGVEIRLNQTHVITQKGVADLFQSLPQWREQKYLYSVRSLRGLSWQLSFVHLAEWQNNGSGLYSEGLVQSFVNGHACAGGLAGGLHVRQLQGAFLGALRQVFPEKLEKINAFWDKGITLFFGLNLVEPSFQDLGKTQLIGSEMEILAIAQECREQLLELIKQDSELKLKLERLLDDCSLANEQEEYSRWQSRLTGNLQEVEEQAHQIDQILQGAEAKYSKLDGSLQTALDESEEIQSHWKKVSSQLTMDMEQAENELNELKKLQRAEQRHYRKEQEKRLENLEEEQQAYLKLKNGLQQKADELLAKEQQHQQLVSSGLESWSHLQQALEGADALQKQRDVEQEQILEYLRSARSSAEAEVGIAKQNIKLAEQKMLQRQESYLKNFQDNAQDGFATVSEEIDQRKESLAKALDVMDQKAHEKLQRLHERFSESLVEENSRWELRLEEAHKGLEENWQQSMKQRQEVLENLNKSWSKQEEALEKQRQKQRNFMDRWQERLNEGRREAQAHQDAQHELVSNRKELEKFLAEQKSDCEEQSKIWQNSLQENNERLAANQKLISNQFSAQHEAQQQQQQEWEQQLQQQSQGLKQIQVKQVEAFESLGNGIRQEIEQEMQRRLADWLENLEKLGKGTEEYFTAKQKLLLTKQQSWESELSVVQHEKDKLWSQWEQDFSNAKEEMSKQLAQRKDDWEQRQETLLQEFDSHLEKLKQKQYAQQNRIEDAQTEQIQILKQVKHFQQEADERLNGLNKNLSDYTAELRSEIESSISELRSNTDHQFAQVEQSSLDQVQLYHQGLLEREQEAHSLLEKYEKGFTESLGEWSAKFTKRFDEQKLSLQKSLDDFGKGLKERQQRDLELELGEWSDKFLAEQNNKEKQAAQDAQRKRNQFWREQQLVVQEEAQQQRREFQELHKELQSAIERERERLQKELGYLQQQAQQQEEALESLNHHLTRDVEQRSERLKQEMEENYRQFYEEILGNTRELHQINSEERKALRDDLLNMRSDVDSLTGKIDFSEQTLTTIKKALPESLKLEKSLEELAQKEQWLRDMENEITQLQQTLNENSQIGQKTSEQLAALLSRRNELNEMTQEMEQVLQLSGDLYQQRESLEQQQQKVSTYQGQLDKLEYLYSESSSLLELFDKRKDQLLEAASLMQGYNADVGDLDQKIQILHEQLEPLELGFGRAQELQQELAEQQQQLQDTQQELRQMQESLAELHEDSQGIDKMREWIAKTETRMLELSQDIQNNLQTVETIVRKNRPSERSFSRVGGKVDNDVRNTVIQLHGKSWNSSEIARATQLSVGEVELILEMLPSAS